MAKSAIIPGSVEDPTGLTSLERRASKEFKRRIKMCLAEYKKALASLEAAPVVNKRYEFRIDPYAIEQMFRRLDDFVESVIVGSGTPELNWFFDGFIVEASERGAIQQHANLTQQSDVYAAARPSVADVIRSEAYRRRMALIKAREFEEMENISAAVKSSMTRILADGIGRGLNPRDISRTLTEQAGIESRRAEKIARTEITTALRRARLDEAEEATETLGLKSKEMHLSALSQTTRPSHAARHGKLFTVDEERDFWSRDGNSINCLCSTATVLVDESGKPLSSAAVDRARAVKQKMEKRGYEWAK